MKAWHIREWQQRYEVDDRGHAARPDTRAGKLRQGRLPYVRFKVNGRAKGAGYRRLEAAAGTATRLEAAMCLWPKLLEIAADGSPEQRGWILNEEGRPASLRDLQFFTGFRLVTIRSALQVLSHPKVRWIIEGELRETPGIPGNSRLKETKRKPNTEQIKPDETNGAPGNPGDAAAGSDGRSASEDSGGARSDSGFVARGRPNALGVAQGLALHLGLKNQTAEPGSRREKQLKADVTCLQIMAVHIVQGHLGEDVKRARDTCYAKAQEFRGAGLKKPIAKFQTWFKEQLASEGHKWR